MNIANYSDINVAEYRRFQTSPRTGLFNDPRVGVASLTDDRTTCRERRLFDAFKTYVRPAANSESPGGGGRANLGATAFTMSVVFGDAMTTNLATGPTNL